MRRFALASVLLAAVIIAAGSTRSALAATASKPPPSAALCKHGGYSNYIRADGSTFASQRECLRYVAAAGILYRPASLSVQSLLHDPPFCAVVCTEMILSGSGFTPLTTVTISFLAAAYDENNVIRLFPVSFNIPADSSGSFVHSIYSATAFYCIEGGQTSFDFTAVDPENFLAIASGDLLCSQLLGA